MHFPATARRGPLIERPSVPRMAPETPTADLDAALARAERLGHRFAAPPAPALAAPAALPGGAPIQRVFDVAAFKAALAKGHHALALKHVDGANPRELEALYGDTEIGHADLGALFEKSENPQSKLHLWKAFHAKSSEGPARALDPHLPLTKQGSLEAGILEDVQSSAAHLSAQHAQSRWTFDSTKNRQIDELAADRRRAREVELKHGVSIRPSRAAGLGDAETTGEFRAFSRPELGQLGDILTRLPKGHVAGNPNLQYIRREQRGAMESLGALYKPGESGLDIYDQPKGAFYRATGETSELGEHGEKNPVSPLDEVVTHEIGHAVERQHPAAFAKLKAAAGWEEYGTGDEARAALTGAGMEDEAAGKLLAGLEANRGKSFGEQPPAYHGGYEYRAHPDDKRRFVRRRLNRMPGDPATPESAPGHADYAKTSPKEHFAELYAQMVHVPERTYRDYVRGPKERLAEAKKTLEEHQAAHAQAIETHGPESEQAREVALQVESAQRGFDVRQEQHDALGKQWDVMREEVFGADPGALARLEPKVRAKTSQQGLDEEAAVSLFRRNARRAATPRQLRLLGGQVLRHLAAKKK